MTPGLRPSLAPTINPSKVTCFNCNEVGHYTNACPNPYITLKINKINQDTRDLSNKANNINKDNTNSESEN